MTNTTHTSKKQMFDAKCNYIRKNLELLIHSKLNELQELTEMLKKLENLEESQHQNYETINTLEKELK